MNNNLAYKYLAINNVSSNKLTILVTAACLALSASVANAQSITLNYDYMATNKAGNFATASGGAAISVATLKLQDFAAGGTYQDAASATQNNVNGGVRATFNVNANGLSQFSSGVGSVYISAFEHNFPNTEMTDGFDSNGAGGKGNNWANVSGVPLAGGVEWQEAGATNGWIGFGQENNWGAGTGSGLMTQTNGGATIDFFNALGASDLSIASIIANSVANANATLPEAFSWIKIRSNAGLPANRGLAASGWWGNSAQNNATATGRYSLDVLATSFTIDTIDNPIQVPVPAALPLMASALGLFGIGRRQRNKAK